MDPDEKLCALIREVERFLNKPGCNAPSKRTAMERLRWALDEALKADPPRPTEKERQAWLQGDWDLSSPGS